jgi:MoaA/NifB/PqqE/SkfB family radical SAM enzyme
MGAIRKGFISIAARRLLQGDLFWLMRQTLKYRRIRTAIRCGNGTTKAPPIIAHYFCTQRCNLTCPMCDIPGRGGKELDTSGALRVIDELAKLGVSGISFTGGEPLLRTDIFELIAAAIRNKLEAILVTNGIELSRHAAAIANSGISVVNVSIDGSTVAIHDASRGKPGSFDRTVEGIASLRAQADKSRARIQLVASCVLSPNNISDLDAVIAKCKEIGFDRIVFCPIHVFSPGACHVPLLDATPGPGHRLLMHPHRAMIDNSNQYLQRLDAVLAGNGVPAGCTAGYTTLILDHEGCAYPCKCRFEVRQPLVSPAPNQSLSDIWYGTEFSDFRKTCRSCTDCYMTINREFDGLFV